MILISDCGSTKADWCVVSEGNILHRFVTKGINPFYQTEEEISREVEDALMPNLKSFPVTTVHFYGAGCAFPEKNEIVRRAISRYLPVAVEVGSDLLAAARALCGRNAGIACIMGTGSNSCQYDGKEIVRRVSPLGFILGDEGSGATLGRLLVGDVLKNQLSPELNRKFYSQYALTPEIIMERVYRQPFPNRFLASLSPFLLENIEELPIHALVCGSFEAFFTRNVMQYEYQTYPVHLSGSVAWYYQKQLREVADRLGIALGLIVQSPMNGLIEYHTIVC